MRKPIQLFHFDCFALLACSKEDLDEESYFFTLHGFFSARGAAEEFAISCERMRVEAIYADWDNHSFNVRRTLAEHPSPTMFAIIPLSSVETSPICPLTDLDNSLEDVAKRVLRGIGGVPFIVQTLDIRRDREAARA